MKAWSRAIRSRDGYSVLLFAQNIKTDRRDSMYLHFSRDLQKIDEDTTFQEIGIQFILFDSNTLSDLGAVISRIRKAALGDSVELAEELKLSRDIKIKFELHRYQSINQYATGVSDLFVSISIFPEHLYKFYLKIDSSSIEDQSFVN